MATNRESDVKFHPPIRESPISRIPTLLPPTTAHCNGMGSFWVPPELNDASCAVLQMGASLCQLPQYGLSAYNMVPYAPWRTWARFYLANIKYLFNKRHLFVPFFVMSKLCVYFMCMSMYFILSFNFIDGVIVLLSMC